MQPEQRRAAERKPPSRARPPRRERRERILAENLVKPTFPPDLPITARADEIVALLRRHRVLVVAGETGSGKTTQLPKACLAAGIGRRGAIAHTQPRRLAARTVAARIAEELGVALGAEVGYAVRFQERASADTVVRVMTDGLLLNEIQRDPWLRRYECVIVDEAHERSLNVDFILGCLKRLLRRRRDLKVIVTSATIDVTAFAGHFDGAPVVEVSGRGYPVATVYRPAPDDPEHALTECLDAIAKEAPAGRRDILVFQSGEREIFDNAQLLKRRFADRFEILPLYARLPASEQQRVFAPGRRQRVVLATNVAETSITVPNIGYVVDPGFARISRYSYRAKLQRLPIEAVSQASAAQRAGRCGRVAPGVCYRLYGEEDFAARPAYTDPELKRTNLAAVVLAMRAFRLGDIEDFPFIDPPEPRAVSDAVRLLHELNALDNGELTEIGRTMARLPVDPRLARMLVEAARTGALADMLIVVSALAGQDPRLRPLDRRDAADQAHAEFVHGGRDDGDTPPGQSRKTSDFLTYVNLWRWLEQARAEHTRSGLRRLLEKRFLSPARVREWRALHRQLLLVCRELGMRAGSQASDYATLHRALLAGSLGFVGAKREPDDGAKRDALPSRSGKPRRRRQPEYDGPRGMRFRVFPGSALAGRTPPWLVAAEISDSGAGHAFARCAAAVEPEWIEDAARHIAKSSFSEPRWDARRGEAVVTERVTVYGLPVIGARTRRAADADPAAAREIFAREALVGADSRIDAPFLARNERLRRRVEERQAKGRRMDLLVGEKARADFYLARLPAGVCSIASWRSYAAGASKATLAKFEMTEADLVTDARASFGADDFPTRLRVGDLDVPIAYKFAPGEPDDGVTARVDLGLLSMLRPEPLDWLVPGFFEAKCLVLVKALPKALRRRLAPAPDRVRAILPELQAPSLYRQGELLHALSAAIRKAFGVDVPVSEWRQDGLPPHLRMNVQVRGPGRRVVDQDRDLGALQGRMLAKVEQAVAGDFRASVERRAIAEFPEQGLPASLAVRGPNGRAVVYPVLVDRGDSVDLLVHATAKGRAALNRGGYTRLALLADARNARHLRREAERQTEVALRYARLGAPADFADAVLRAAAWFAYFDGRDLPDTRVGFDARLAERKGALTPIFREVLNRTNAVLAKRAAVVSAIETLDSPAFAPSRDDLRRQLDAIVHPDFLAATPRDRLADLPRYLDAMIHRIDNLPGRVPRDHAGMAAVAPWERRLAALREAAASADDTTALAAETVELGFLVQEFRVATFSQRLGTRGKVSAKRLQARFEAAESRAGVS